MLEVADWLAVVDTVSIADNSLGKRYRALQILYHPRFNRYNNDYDVGLLRTVTDMDMKGKRRGLHVSAGLGKNASCTLLHFINTEGYLTAKWIHSI